MIHSVVSPSGLSGDRKYKHVDGLQVTTTKGYTQKDIRFLLCAPTFYGREVDVPGFFLNILQWDRIYHLS